MEQLSIASISVEYRVAILVPLLDGILVRKERAVWCLPHVKVPVHSRRAHEIQRAVWEKFQIRIWILDYLGRGSVGAACTFAELLTHGANSRWTVVSADDVPHSELSEQEKAYVASLFADNRNNPLARVGWLDEAVGWLESETKCQIASKCEIEQFNAGGGFVLLRALMTNGHFYWLKATGYPNHHEPSVTQALSRYVGVLIPQVIALRLDWNAFIVPEIGTAVEAIPSDTDEARKFLEAAVESFVQLQAASESQASALVKAGAFDQRSIVLLHRLPAFFDFVEEAVGSGSGDHRVVSTVRLKKIQEHVTACLERLSSLQLPETVLHGDLNLGNMVRVDAGRFQFIDWSEAYLGCCIAGFEPLLQMCATANAKSSPSIVEDLKRQYLAAWGRSHQTDSLQKSLRYSAVLAAISALYGRGNWLASAERRFERFDFARKVVHHLDRAVSQASIKSVSCCE